MTTSLGQLVINVPGLDLNLATTSLAHISRQRYLKKIFGLKEILVTFIGNWTPDGCNIFCWKISSFVLNVRVGHLPFVYFILLIKLDTIILFLWLNMFIKSYTETGIIRNELMNPTFLQYFSKLLGFLLS